ncbi:uncharacterized protein LOC120626029 [Pararge aegeria]|uniref:uncharacterized protein LOC120626029 n=1 Tax=Pararge aegeria TaxID=116150 RepID=UPI0019D1DA95|nr:uncharacterized protein LOC120626029 [Pararge aegeria]
MVSPKLPLTSIRSNLSSEKTKSHRQTNIMSASEEKYKPSLIPRRRTAKGFHCKEPVSIQSINKNISSRQQSLIKQTNSQRVQLLNINPDWYLESDRNSDIPQESNVSNATINTDLQSDGTSKPNENEPSNGLDNTTNMKTFHITDPLKVFKFKNDNISNWISSELDNSTKDDESGIQFHN